MNDSAIAGSVNEAASSGRPRSSETILYGGLAVGVLDILDAITFFGIKYDMTPVHVLQPVVGGYSVTTLSTEDSRPRCCDCCVGPS